MFIRRVLLAENLVFGRVRRLNRYLSVAFFLSGIPVLKTVLPMDGYWLRNLFIYMPHVVLSPDYDRETEPAADEIIKCCRFCFCDIKSKMGYKFHDYLILF